MHVIESSITGISGNFEEIRDAIDNDGFTLANWDYDHGFFDKQLDEKAMVFLRIPIEVIDGQLDSIDAFIRFGTPFVLKHVYQTDVEVDPGDTTGLFSSFVNQFQEPADKDASVEAHWVEKATEVLRQLEQKFSYKQ